MTANYQSKHIQSLFDISPQTVRAWANEFAQYLSVDASPSLGRHRVFTEDDLKVFALVKEMKDEKKLYDDIHLSLQSGARGEMPSLPDDDLVDLVATKQGIQLLNNLRMLMAKMSEIDRRFNQLESTVKDREVQDLRQQLKENQDEKMELMRQIGRLEALLEVEKEKNSKLSNDE